MKNVLRNALPLAVIGVQVSLLLSSCAGDLLVGEQRCYGEGIDCASDAPTFEPDLQDMLSGVYDVEASQAVAATWIYEHPLDPHEAVEVQLARAPGGGVWALFVDDPQELQRLNADGEPVESHALEEYGTLSVNDELTPIVLGWANSHIRQTTLGPTGEIFTWTVGPVEPLQSTSYLLLPGPEGTVRVGAFGRRTSYVAEFSSLGELLWRQSNPRNARDFPFETRPETFVQTSYRMIALSDGSIALGAPKNGRVETGPGGGLFYTPAREAQGITLIDADGNVRWDIALGPSTWTMQLAPGPDGGVIFGNAYEDFLQIAAIDRHGSVLGFWAGTRLGYHSLLTYQLCIDPAGDIFSLTLSGDRRHFVPTVCRHSTSEPEREVVCVGVEDALLSPEETPAAPMLLAMTAPEPGSIVFALQQAHIEPEKAVLRLVRVDF